MIAPSSQRGWPRSSKGSGKQTKWSLCASGTAAERLKISPNSVKHARKLLGRGDPALIARVQYHELSVSAASRLLSPPAQPRVVSEGYTIEQWHALSDDERAALLVLRNRKARLNRQNPTEDGNTIDWARSSYSPITGCRHNCPYCYIDDFVTVVPMFHPDRLSAPLNQSPPVTNDIRDRCIFVGTLADLFGQLGSG